MFSPAFSGASVNEVLITMFTKDHHSFSAVSGRCFFLHAFCYYIRSIKIHNVKDTHQGTREYAPLCKSGAVTQMFCTSLSVADEIKMLKGAP